MRLALVKNKVSTFLLDGFVRFMHKGISSIAISGKGFEEKLRPYVRQNMRFHYLPNWADSLDMSVQPVILSQKPLVHFTFAGNIGKQQNLENIISAFCLMPTKYQEQSQLNIIGDGPKCDELQSFSKDNSRVVFHGKQKREDMSCFYKASDFLIVSLVDEPIFSVTVPSKTQTYISAKKPILAIINGDTADLVKDYNLGSYAHPSDVLEISNLFQECINMDDEQRHKFVSQNDYLLDVIFNREKIIDGLLECLINPNSGNLYKG
jgi:glycosyltransferase involved in cell wall biosynthesis